MDFFEEVVKPGVGLIVLGIIIYSSFKSCWSDSDSVEQSAVSTPRSEYQSTGSSSSSSSYPEPEPELEWVEEWYDDPICHGSGKCSVCDGEGGYRIDNLYYQCGGCNGTGICGSCGGKGQCPITRQVYR